MLVHNPEERMTAADAIKHNWFKESPLPQKTEWMPSYPKEISEAYSPKNRPFLPQ